MLLLMFTAHALKLERISNLSILLRFLHVVYKFSCLRDANNSYIGMVRDILAQGFRNIPTSKPQNQQFVITYKNTPKLLGK